MTSMPCCGGSRTTIRLGTTVILTTDYLEEAESLCRQIAIIDHGRIVVNSPMQDLLTQVQTHRYTLELKQAVDSMPEIPGFAVDPIDAGTLSAEIPSGVGIPRYSTRSAPTASRFRACATPRIGWSSISCSWSNGVRPRNARAEFACTPYTRSSRAGHPGPYEEPEERA